MPLRLNYPGTFTATGASNPGAYLAPPKDLQELESRRRTWWMTIMFDRIVSVGGWLHGVDERDIGTEFPLRRIDYETNVRFSCMYDVPQLTSISQANIPSNRQDLFTPDLFTHHPPLYTDAFILFLKAVMLFGRVTDYNTRNNLRANAPPSKNQNPFALPGFKELDQLVAQDFLHSLPPEFKHWEITADGALDTDLYMVHLVPHAYVPFHSQVTTSV